MRLIVTFLTIALLAPAIANAAIAEREHRAGIAENLAPALAVGELKVPVIIQFVDRPTADDARALEAAGFEVPFIRYSVVDAVSTVGSAAAIKKIAANERVTYIERDVVNPYTLNKAKSVGRADTVWDATYKVLGALHSDGITGRGVGVAVVDSGIDATHPDLLWKPLAEAQGIPAKTIINNMIIGRDSLELTGLIIPVGNIVNPFLEANQLTVDEPDTDIGGGHGTHVAGSVAGTGRVSEGKYVGAAPGANLIGFGAGQALLTTLGLAAFDWIHINHADPAYNIRIVTNSWGGPGDWRPESAVTKAVRKLANEDGLLVIFAAGNDYGDGSEIMTSVWGNIPETLMIANYYDTTGWLDDSSSRGLKTLPRTWPDLAAPGTQIISTASTAGPVSYVGTGQDYLITVLDGTGEPLVASTPAATPVVVETDVEGQNVVVGPYTSMTGTSMATPFVAGVAALVFEANPALTWQEVKDILRATANMPVGRYFETDGFAIGRGVVDAAEAVAVALRMRDGDSLADALRFAYVDATTAPAALNVQLPRTVALSGVADGDTLTGPSVTVSGDFVAGPVTNDSIPYAPPPAGPGGSGPTLSGNANIYHGVAGAGVNPFLVCCQTVLPGENVSLAVRFIVSNDPEVTVALGGFTATHRVMRDGVLAYGPFTARTRADSTGVQSDNPWIVPSDAPTGTYVFEGLVTVTATGNTYPSASLPFSIGLPSLPEAPPTTSSTVGVPLPRTGLESNTVFFDDFESGGDAWEMQQNGFANGLLTEWMHTDTSDEDLTFLTWAGPHSGDSFFYVGAWATHPIMNGLAYTDNANVSIISPPIDLTSASAAELSYWRAGSSEAGYDFLTVYAAVDGSTDWVQIDQTSGMGELDWTESTASLTAMAGKVIRLRFAFTSDLFSEPDLFNFLGWNIDDVRVTAGVASLAPTLSATRTFALLGMETTLAFGEASGVSLDSITLDFGDGSPVLIANSSGAVAHVYTVGQHIATLTVTSGALTATKTILIDVAPVGEVQVRIAGQPWVDAGAASTSDTGFSALVDLSGVAAGPAVLEVRHFDANGRRVTQAINVIVA